MGRWKVRNEEKKRENKHRQFYNLFLGKNLGKKKLPTTLDWVKMTLMTKTGLN